MSATAKRLPFGQPLKIQTTPTEYRICRGETGRGDETTDGQFISPAHPLNVVETATPFVPEPAFD